MAIPDFQSVMRPVLAAAQSGASLSLSELRERIADQFQLTEDERKARVPSGQQTIINNRISWARTYLNKAGLLTAPAKGMAQITARGLAALALRRSMKELIISLVRARHERACRYSGVRTY